MQKFKDVMFDDLTQEQIAMLTDDERALWLFRPKPDDLSAAKTAMYLRVAAILLGCIYFYSHSRGGAGLMICVLLTYEYAYYNTRKQKAALVYEMARQEYIAEIEQLGRGA